MRAHSSVVKRQPGSSQKASPTSVQPASAIVNAAVIASASSANEESCGEQEREGGRDDRWNPEDVAEHLVLVGQLTPGTYAHDIGLRQGTFDLSHRSEEFLA